MTVGKNTGWGHPGVLPDGAPIADSDLEVRQLLEKARRTGVELPMIGLRRGDLARTVGAPPDGSRMRGPDAVALPMDLGTVLVDGRLHHFVAHLIARRSWWRGRVVAIMNAQWLGRWDVAPKSHPNDGLLDVFDADLSIDDRWKARSRLPTGTHVPHPGIRQRRVESIQIRFERPTPVRLDGELIGPARDLVVRLESDAWTAVV